MPFIRPEHNLIAEILGSMNNNRLLASNCFFGGGTAIVLKYGEYRRSLDLDFLCADVGGYRELRNAFFEEGARALFAPTVRSLRDVRADGYGIRLLLEYKGQRLKFEIVRESRISLSGDVDPVLGVPILRMVDMFTEKLLANADRCFDRSVAYRDVIDLACLLEDCGEIPAEAIAKAEVAYGPDIARKMAGVLNHLLDTEEIRYATSVMDMDYQHALHAIASLRLESRRLWPEAGITEDPKVIQDNNPD
ncbi:hypothetical protein ACO34A_06485 [Rhizobium sp. ACO-34A]|nr:nucleotidyl transferase AbiEii/AbiGii toxin family protein [Rhizobium sp. ACO-34A]ATN33452.1 hypothetical protein ACO34A_06485 [Rhizobium sp. ACO-34A]